MLDFGVLPPEVTSVRMYTGPGSGSLLAAAGAWDALAAQLQSVSSAYSSMIAGLLDEVWSGPASAAMAQAAAPFVDWATSTGTQAEQTATQVRAAAAAFETAHAAVVPPPLVIANRTRLANLVATNIFGQNTAQIAATEAEHAQMWAQNTRAMYGYAASSTAATQLTPLTEPPQTTSATGQSAQAAAAAHAAGTAANSQLTQAMSLVPQQLNALSTPAAPSPSASDSLLTAFSDFNTLTGPAGLAQATSRTATSAGSMGFGIFRSVLQAQGAAAKAIPELAPAITPPPLPSVGLRSIVLASAGQAEPIGGLSVPPAWSSATPAPTAFAESPWLSEAELAEASSWEALPAANAAEAAPMAGMGPMAPLAAGAAMAAGGRGTVSSMLRVAPSRFRMPRPAAGG
ncbi:MAG TPA: PPE family protein [Mycobacterium sp.]|nr:PPE family protein [Mycobacterium sp.]